MSRAPFRVHGPILHRRRWRLDVYAEGRRTKLTFASYRDALMKAHELLTGAGNALGNATHLGNDDLG